MKRIIDLINKVLRLNTMPLSTTNTDNQYSDDICCLSQEEYQKLVSGCQVISPARKYSLSYSEFREIWDFMSPCVEKNGSNCSLEIKYCYLFVLRWGIVALISFANDHLTFSALFTAISNTSMSIVQLIQKGYIVQASVLSRNLYETCMTLIALIIDPEKRESFVKGSLPETERVTWHNSFSFKALEKSIEKYDNKLQNIIPDPKDLSNWRNKLYRKLSSTNHNNYWSLFQCLDNDVEEGVSLNLWGMQKTQIEETLRNLKGILWYTEVLFNLMLDDEEIDIDIYSFISTQEEKDIWIAAKYIGFLASYTYLIDVGRKTFPDMDQDQINKICNTPFKTERNQTC